MSKTRPQIPRNDQIAHLEKCEEKIRAAEETVKDAISLIGNDLEIATYEEDLEHKMSDSLKRLKPVMEVVKNISVINESKASSQEEKRKKITLLLCECVASVENQRLKLDKISRKITKLQGFKKIECEFYLNRSNELLMQYWETLVKLSQQILIEN